MPACNTFVQAQPSTFLREKKNPHFADFWRARLGWIASMEGHIYSPSKSCLKIKKKKPLKSRSPLEKFLFSWAISPTINIWLKYRGRKNRNKFKSHVFHSHNLDFVHFLYQKNGLLGPADPCIILGIANWGQGLPNGTDLQKWWMGWRLHRSIFHIPFSLKFTLVGIYYLMNFCYHSSFDEYFWDHSGIQQMPKRCHT